MSYKPVLRFDGFYPSSLPYASNRLGAVHDRHQTAPPCLQQKREPAQPEHTVHHGVPGWPSQLPAGSIQSPYVHRANGLAQIAVSTMLRTRSIANRKSQHAEHCRYGTRDLALTDMLSVCHPKTRARPLACWRAEGVEQVQGDVPRSRAEFRGDRTEVHASLWRKTDLPARLLEDLNPRGCRSSAACGNAVPRHAEVLPLGRKQRRRIPL